MGVGVGLGHHGWGHHHHHHHGWDHHGWGHHGWGMFNPPVVIPVGSYNNGAQYYDKGVRTLKKKRAI